MEEAGIIVVVVLGFVGKLRCCIPRNRSSPGSLRQVAPSVDEWHQVWRGLGDQ